MQGGRARPGFGTETFAVVIFGQPSETEPWAFQLDGHHVGVNVAITGADLTMAPSFIGTQPESFQLADETVRPLKNGVDGAYELAMSLNDDQRRKAVVQPTRGRIVTGPGADAHVPNTQGISVKEFSDEQKAKLMMLVECWVGDMPTAHATKKMQQVKESIDEMYFSWNGETDKDSDVSWRIQGPNLIIEYACQDLGGNPLQHLHTMYRDPTNDYGKQLDP